MQMTLSFGVQKKCTTTATYRMQQALNKIKEWKNNWCITINKENSSATLLFLPTKTQAGQLHIEDTHTPLQYEDQQTYLGVIFDKKTHLETTDTECRGESKKKAQHHEKASRNTVGCQ
jgi:hypothetical protein